MKNSRHDTILQIINNNDVETQEELAEHLSAAGFEVTQATISRDIHKLHLTKVMGDKGKQKYVSLRSFSAQIDDISRRTVRDAVVSIASAGNLLVIKTRTGMGMAVAVNIDSLEMPEVLGTIAGDDTVFCAVAEPNHSDALKEYFNKLAGQK